jgi:uncharacterized membrane protein YphA (DoxX/SURF4 family)
LFLRAGEAGGYTAVVEEIRTPRRTRRYRHSGRIARLRSRAYDVLALATRLGLGAAFAVHGAYHLQEVAQGARSDGPWSAVAVAEVAAGAALALGAASVLAGPVLALAAALRLLAPQDPAQLTGFGGETLPVAALVCLLLAVNAGRLSLDHLLGRVLRRRPRSAFPPATPGGTAKRPENAPPLPYPGDRYRFGERRRAE